MNALLTICSIFCAIFVESFGPRVMLKTRDSGTWTHPTHGQTVSRMDSVAIPKGEKITFIDDANGNVYDCTSPQNGNVNQCMNQARNDASNVLLSLAAQIKSNALGQNKKAKQQPIYGGTTRAEEDDEKNDSIACLVLAASRLDTTTYSQLTLLTITDGEYISFAVENNGSDAYYINIIAVNTLNGNLSLCIVPSPDVEADALLLPPAETMDLSMFRFLKRTEIKYVLFATQTPFIPSYIQSILCYPEDINCSD